MKLSRYFYKASRRAGRLATKLNDIETLMSGNPKKIAKRAIRKSAWKTNNRMTRKMTNKIK